MACRTQPQLRAAGGGYVIVRRKRESGSVLVIIGWVMMLFAFLVMFFHPAAVKLGDLRIDIIAVCLAGLGLLLRTVGARVKSHSR